MEYLLYGIVGVAVILMLIALIRAVSLYRHVPGGDSKKKLRLLVVLQSIFLAGYLASPLLIYTDNSDIKDIVVFGVFLLGAIFVLISIAMIRSILKVFKVLK